MSFRYLSASGFVLLALGMAVFWWWPRDTGDAVLAHYVSERPSWSVVFTSRSSTASFQAAAEPGTGFTAPGQPQWQASEGRLRLLTPQGQVHELTWGRQLPTGDSLCDVMSPSVAPDGQTVVFAGRLASGAEGGRFRIYAIDLNSRQIRQLTGGKDDAGCVALPPLRLDQDGHTLPDEVRRQTDYDDVDPVLCPDGTLFFASSRLPDLGSTHGRRATQIWIKRPNKTPTPFTANRANDRWPYLLNNGYLTFSLWSHQDEVISSDGRTLIRDGSGEHSLTKPVDRWFAATEQVSGERFAMLAKIPQPMWRPRPLANGHVAFMSPADPATSANNQLRVAQCEPGVIASAPSSLAAGETLPSGDQPRVWWLPSVDGQQQRWSFATPAAGPPSAVLLSAAPVMADNQIHPGGYGLYQVAQAGWQPSADANEPSPALTPQLLFDDPLLVDAEPAAIYARKLPSLRFEGPNTTFDTDQTIDLANGQQYHGPAGEIHAMGIYFRELANLPGQQSKQGAGPIFAPFPQDSMKSLAIYASRRDRFDDPDKPWIPGELELLLKTPVDPSGSGSAKAILPVGVPTILLGLDADGKVVSGLSEATNEEGQHPKFYALAGDHVSGVRNGGYHFCTGCHAGHTHPLANDFAERLDR